MLPTRDPAQDKRPTQTESEGLEQIIQANGQEKKAGVALLISDKIAFRKRAIKRAPEGHFIILKGQIHQEVSNIVNIYALNIGAPKYIMKILGDFKKDIDRNTITIGDFNTLLSKIYRCSSVKMTANSQLLTTTPKTKTRAN